MGLLVSIDNGGTLTDICAVSGGEVFHGKTLTTPHDLSQCFMDSLRVLAQRMYGSEDISRLVPEIEYIRYSTTQGTNALVERKGPRLGLICDDENIVGGLRYDDNAGELFDSLVGDRHGTIDMAGDDAEVDGGLTAIVNDLTMRGANRLIVSFSGPDYMDQEIRFRRLLYRRIPRHLLGAVPVLFANELSKDGGHVRRTWAAILNSFLHPSMEHFLYNAENKLREARARNPLLIFRNDGNSTRVAQTVALNTYSSGPRGGIEAGVVLNDHYGIGRTISMDIGGTTTDVAVFEENAVEEQRYGLIEGVEVPFRMADVRSVGAGGGSIIAVRDGALSVGPESVGAAPGPICFNRGGTEPTITDVYLLMGVLDAESYFGGKMRLDADKAGAVIADKIAKPLGLSLADTLSAMADAYHGKIADAIRYAAEGHPETVLMAFGGAGPMSGCNVAEKLGLGTVLVPCMSAVFSAFGIGFSDIAHSYTAVLSAPDGPAINDALGDLRLKAERGMKAEGFTLDECKLEATLIYRDGDSERRSDIDPNTVNGVSALNEDVQLILKATRPIAHFSLTRDTVPPRQSARSSEQRSGLLGDLPLYRLDDLTPGDEGPGPAVIEEDFFTCHVPASWSFSVTSNRDIILRLKEETGS